MNLRSIDATTVKSQVSQRAGGWQKHQNRHPKSNHSPDKTNHNNVEKEKREPQETKLTPSRRTAPQVFNNRADHGGSIPRNPVHHPSIQSP
jgi:hypothetical protein